MYKTTIKYHIYSLADMMATRLTVQIRNKYKYTN